MDFPTGDPGNRIKTTVMTITFILKARPGKPAHGSAEE